MKFSFIVGSVVAVLLLLISPSAQEALLLFVVSGAIPGTSLQIPAVPMLLLWLGLIIALLYWAQRETRKVATAPQHAAKQPSISQWRNTFGPQLQLLQQKLLTFGLGALRYTIELLHKLWQIIRQAV